MPSFHLLFTLAKSAQFCTCIKQNLNTPCAHYQSLKPKNCPPPQKTKSAQKHTIYQRHFFSSLFTIASLLFISIATTITSCSQPPQPLVVGFYNCENLFDTSISSPSDTDFVAGGPHNNNTYIYTHRLRQIATAISSIHPPHGPTILGLAEVENTTVLKDLIAQPHIRRPYKGLLSHGSDKRGIQVGLLYDSTIFKVIQVKSVTIPINGSTRDILHVTGLIKSDTIHILVNHWPSRTGNDSLNENRRLTAAYTCQSILESITTKNPNALIITMGDFNDNPTDSSISILTHPSTHQLALYNPFTTSYHQNKGTIMHSHRWHLFDQILLSQSWTSLCNNTLPYGNIINYPFLHKKQDTTAVPHKAWLGSYYTHGHSDHLPVSVTLNYNTQ